MFHGKGYMSEAKYMMRKSDFVMSGRNDYIIGKGTHVAVTFEQMKFVAENPAVNGPKVLLFLLTANGMPPGVVDAGFDDMLRKAQADKDKQGAAYVEPPASGPATEVKPAEAEPVADASVANEAIEQVRAHLMTIEDKAEIAKYAEATLGLNLSLKGNWGKERMIESIVSALAKPKA